MNSRLHPWIFGIAAVIASTPNLWSQAPDNGVPASEVYQWKEIWDPTTGSHWRTQYEGSTGNTISYDPFTSEIWKNPVTGNEEAVLREDWVNAGIEKAKREAAKQLDDATVRESREEEALRAEDAKEEQAENSKREEPAEPRSNKAGKLFTGTWERGNQTEGERVTFDGRGGFKYEDWTGEVTLPTGVYLCDSSRSEVSGSYQIDGDSAVVNATGYAIKVVNGETETSPLSKNGPWTVQELLDAGFIKNQ